MSGIDWYKLIEVKMKKHGWLHTSKWLERMYRRGNFGSFEEYQRLAEYVLGCPLVSS